MPQLPELSFELFRSVFASALTVAFLAAVESLLSAKVVDSMSGDAHNPNAELIGEGLANIGSAFFMGLPATGANAHIQLSDIATASNYDKAVAMAKRYVNRLKKQVYVHS